MSTQSPRQTPPASSSTTLAARRAVEEWTAMFGAVVVAGDFAAADEAAAELEAARRELAAAEKADARAVADAAAERKAAKAEARQTDLRRQLGRVRQDLAQARKATGLGRIAQARKTIARLLDQEARILTLLGEDNDKEGVKLAA